MPDFPDSVFTQTKGLVYFARMLSKIRLHTKGKLHPDYQNNLGHGADGWCCGFLHVDYDSLKQYVLDNNADNEAAYDWCMQNGRQLNDTDTLIWNNYIRKLGWNDHVTPYLEQRKTEAGWQDRTDIQTMPQFIEADERRPLPALVS